MRPHDSVMMNGADDSALAPVMRSSMVVNLDTRIEAKTFDQPIGIEDRPPRQDAVLSVRDEGDFA